MKINEDHISSISSFEKYIANHLGLESLSYGGHVIRDKRGWRENEKFVEYSWFLEISRSFVGFGGLYFVKFKEVTFRNMINPQELVKGVLTFGDQHRITNHFNTVERKKFDDPIRETLKWDLFEGNLGVTLDGVSYQLKINSCNISSHIVMNNPNSDNWKHWEETVWNIGKILAEQSKQSELMELFN